MYLIEIFKIVWFETVRAVRVLTLVERNRYFYLRRWILNNKSILINIKARRVVFWSFEISEYEVVKIIYLCYELLRRIYFRRVLKY